MAEPKDGGPAFPVVYPNPGEAEAVDRGMSLRDYFAAKAMAAFIADGGARRTDAELRASSNANQIQDDQARCSVVNELLASYSYRLADAMLAARAAGERP